MGLWDDHSDCDIDRDSDSDTDPDCFNGMPPFVEGMGE